MISWVADFLPDIAPLGWKVIKIAEDGAAFMSADRMSLIISGSDEHGDGKRWIHLSIARLDRIPDYRDLQRARRDFLGEDRYCAMIFPPKDRYVNINPHCLHLFACLDGWPMPEFSGFVDGIKGRTL